MKEQAVKNARTEEQKASIKDVGRQQLRSWGILIERDEKDYPSNAFAILTGNGGLHVATQVSCKCAWLVEPQILYKKIGTHLLLLQRSFCLSS